MILESIIVLIQVLLDFVMSRALDLFLFSMPQSFNTQQNVSKQKLSYPKLLCL